MPEPLILCYHAVSEDWPTELAVAPRRLDAQLSLLSRRGYRPVTVAEALHRPTAKTVAVTFDDAYRSVIERALPVLSRHGAPATVFAPTAYVGEAEPMTWGSQSRWAATPFAAELECMSWDDLRTLIGAGWEIGSHSHTHPDLTALGEAELGAELSGSRAACEEALQRPCTSLAYPFGAHDRRVAAAAATAGYEAAFVLDGAIAIPPASLVRPGAQTDMLGLLRAGIYRRDGRLRFLAKTAPPVRRLRSSHLAQRAFGAA